MNRRGFLGRLVGAAAAAPSIAQNVTADAMMARQQLYAMPGPSPIGTGSLGGRPRHEVVKALLTNKEALALIRGQAEEFARGTVSAASLDPDLVANRSLSLDARIRIQRRRVVERQMAERLRPWRWWEKLDELGFGDF